jgi:hypothetical protein
MNDIYVMQRANGDVFAFDDHERFRVPLFNSSSNPSKARPVIIAVIGPPAQTIQGIS